MPQLKRTTKKTKNQQKIQDLKELLPKQSADILSNKLTILHESVEHIKNLHQLVDHLNERNQYLEQRLAFLEKDLLNTRQFTQQQQQQQFSIPIPVQPNQPYISHLNPVAYPSPL